MARIYSLAILGVVISAAWCVHVASEVESNSLEAASRTRRRKLESIHVVGDGSNGETSIFDFGGPAATRTLSIGSAGKSDKSSKGAKVKNAKDTRGAKPTVKSAKNAKDTRGAKPTVKSAKDTKVGKTRGAIKSTKDTKVSKTRAVPTVQQVNEEVKKIEELEEDDASALLQMILSSDNELSMSMGMSSSEVDTMDGIVAGTIDVIDNDSSSEESPDEVDGGDDILATEPSLTIDDSPPSTAVPVKATVNNAEGTNEAKDGGSVSFSTLSQLIAVTIVAISIISVSFD